MFPNWRAGRRQETEPEAAVWTYELQGDKDKLLKFMSAKTRVTGQLSGSTVGVETIGRAAKNE
jgi:hypothetical protein